MNPKKLKSVFSFFESKTKYKAPLAYKLIYDQKSLTKEDLKVKGDLILSYTEITNLPKNLKVGGQLDLGFTKIASLPSDLTVVKTLWIENTPLSEKYTEEQIREMVPGVNDIYVG